MQVTSCAASGQATVSVKPGKDSSTDLFAGLLAALSGVIGSPLPVALPETVSANPTGPALTVANGSAGTVPDPYGEMAGVTVGLPALSATVASGSGSTQAGSPTTASGMEEETLASLPGPVPSSPPAGPVSIVTTQPVAPVVGDLSTASPTPSQPAIGAAPVVENLSTPTSLPSQPAVGSASVAETPTLSTVPPVVAQPAISTTSVPLVASVTGGSDQPAVVQTAVKAEPSGGETPIPASLVTGNATSLSPPDVHATPVSSAPLAPQAVVQQTPLAQAAGVSTATPTVVAAPTHVVVSAATPQTLSVPVAAQSAVNISGGDSQSAPNGGGNSSHGGATDSDPGAVANPVAGASSPVFTLSTAVATTPVASLPQQTAQTIANYLNQGGRLPAQLQLQLDPPELGKMTVHLALDAGTLSVTILTASTHARDAVAASLPQMRELLGQNNFLVGHTGVYVGSQAGGQGSSSGNSRGQGLAQPTFGQSDAVVAGEETIPAAAQPGPLGLNILV